MLWLCAHLAAVAASPWPLDDAWQPLGTAGSEPADDALDGSVELAGIPLLRWWTDEATLFLRIALTGDPTGVDQDFGLLVDIDGDAATYEWSVLVQGPDHVLVARENRNPVPGPAIGDWGDPIVLGAAVSGETRPVVDAIDLQLDRTRLREALGIDEATPLTLTPVAAVAWPLGFTDLGGCDDTVGCVDLAAIARGPVRLDGDADGLSSPVEQAAGTRPDDADTDDDGILDGSEATDDNGDGTVDALQCDRDGDGLPDGLEIGLVIPSPDTAPGCFRPDADPTSTTDPNLADTDGGGLFDGVEDADGDGARSAFEPDPTVPGDDVDTDGDGIVDVVDDTVGVGPDADSDGDGLLDVEEGARDTDGDGMPDFADLDSDDDGLPDGFDGADDPDGDGVPSFRDLDSDDDGLPDEVEGMGDADEDGLPDHVETDADDDGFADAFEGAEDTDGDGAADFADTDSDDDGIPDEVERYGDRDGDEVRNARDLDSDGDTLPDAVEYDRFSPDFDGDGRADYFDFDSDDDGIPDRAEGFRDDDCDGRPDFRDDDPEDGDCDPAPLTPPEPGPVDGLPTRDGAPNPLGQPGSFGGGACATGPRGGVVALIVVVGLLGFRSRAHAQTLDASRFAPSADGGRLLVVEEARPPGGSGAQWVGSISRAPFVYRVDDPAIDDLALLDRVVTNELVAWLGARRARLGVRLPVHAWLRGHALAQTTQLGDLEVSGKLGAALGDALDGGLLIAVRLPTGPDGSYLAARRTVVAVSALVTRATQRTQLSGQLGVRSRAGEDLPGLSLGPALPWGLGAALAVHDRLWLTGELDGELALASLGAPGGLPVTAHVGARTGYEVANARIVLGRGLTSGLGAPAWRIVAGFEVSP